MEHSDDNEETKTEYFSTTEYSGGEMYAYSAAPAPEPKEPTVRPGILSVISVLGCIGNAIMLLVGLASSLYEKSPEWHQPFVIVSAMVSFAGYIGVWNMKLWGLYLLVLIFLINVAVALNTNGSGTVSITVSAIVLAIISMNSKKME